MFCGETGSVDILNSGRYFCEVAPGFGRYFNLVVDILIQEKKVEKANNTLGQRVRSHLLEFTTS